MVRTGSVSVADGGGGRMVGAGPSTSGDAASLATARGVGTGTHEVAQSTSRTPPRRASRAGMVRVVHTTVSLMPAIEGPASTDWRLARGPVSRRGSVGLKSKRVPSGRSFCSATTTAMRQHVTKKVAARPYMRVRMGRLVGLPLSVAMVNGGPALCQKRIDTCVRA